MLNNRREGQQVIALKSQNTHKFEIRRCSKGVEKCQTQKSWGHLNNTIRATLPLFLIVILSAILFSFSYCLQTQATYASVMFSLLIKLYIPKRGMVNSGQIFSSYKKFLSAKAHISIFLFYLSEEILNTILGIFT